MQLVVLDSKPYRYQATISDIAGQDIRIHHDSLNDAIRVVRHWLVTASQRRSVPRVSAIHAHYRAFDKELPELCDRTGIDRDDMQFIEYTSLAASWLRAPGL